jgi:hypothetical protein
MPKAGGLAAKDQSMEKHRSALPFGAACHRIHSIDECTIGSAKTSPDGTFRRYDGIARQVFPLLEWSLCSNTFGQKNGGERWRSNFGQWAQY